ncbi:MAG: hypothetical protein D4R74_11690 [Betaproteobacteria bacterium]|nr:MAG: hypothetical protein D4R74_11690 [Betaproteobacteria bacterium]
MNQTKQRESGADQVKPRPRKGWESFWRIIAGLMLLVIVWVAWVMYQIMPRSVVTPLAYANQAQRVGTAQSADGAVSTSAPTAPLPAPESTAADAAMALAQAAMHSGAHQSSADVAAATLEQKPEQIKGEGLRLATEISTPLAEKNRTQTDGKAEVAPSVPVATGAAGKDRP